MSTVTIRDDREAGLVKVALPGDRRFGMVVWGRYESGEDYGVGQW